MKCLPLLSMATCAAALLSGCSGASRDAVPGLQSSTAFQTHVNPLRGTVPRSGVDPRTITAEPAHILAQLERQPRAKIDGDLFISDNGANVFELEKSRRWKKIGDITEGINGADGAFVDKDGNVYVANYKDATVTEYAHGSGSPICTYSSGLVDPINVTVDNSGNVFVVDFNDFYYYVPGYIDEYSQCSNTIAKQYETPGAPEGVAVDKSGDIFIAYVTYASTGAFEEFKAGSSSPTQLGATTVYYPGGLILDKNNNLIADDQVGYIWIIAPPYTRATENFFATGLSKPFHCSLNKKETRLFNANYGWNTVNVYDYRSGALLTTITGKSGIDGAAGVAESPDATF